MNALEILHNPALNKGTAFTEQERDELGLRGFLPPTVLTQEEQKARILENFARKESDLERYIFLMALLDRNERLFYRTVIDHIEALMPIIYTPTVGEASRQYAHIFRRSRGLYITARDRGEIAAVLRNWPQSDVRVTVCTDGERILGLGDLGANGMGIPIGKLALYTAGGGIDPQSTLPIMLDVGTNNEELLDDPLYLGLRQHRLEGQEYFDFIEEFISAAQEVFPSALIQFEDFATRNAYPLLNRYRDRARAFNDDIQGTAAVALGGILAALRITGKALTDQTFLFLGAGSAATGIADLLVCALVKAGLSTEAARGRCWFVDLAGLVVKGREGLEPHNLPYAHDGEFLPDLLSAVNVLAPTALIGATGQPGTFTRPALEAMARINERPIIFALSNPTSRSEATAEQAYQWTQGRAVFASGSPFDPVTYNGRLYVPGQSNNVYIFPGVGLGVVASGAERVTEDMFLIAAETLAGQVTQESLDRGSVFPPLRVIRDVSAAIAVAVSRVAQSSELSSVPLPKDLAAHIQSLMYQPSY